jgi:malonyl-CoA/methylmalonyl-CoA synthetase
MTEIGMALSNPLDGERRAGHVGRPLPGVEVRIVDGRGRPVARGGQGEIEVRGPQVFREYWGRPRETEAGFRGGWFRTGDEGEVDERGYHRILGRRDVDIVKTGGYKVSALEVEELYRTHAAIRDLAVVGIPHPEWGEQLRAACIPASDGDVLCGDELRAWGKERLAPYKVPHAFAAVAELPRNAMGKVQKAAVCRMFMERDTGSPAEPPAPAPRAPTSPKEPS